MYAGEELVASFDHRNYLDIHIAAAFADPVISRTKFLEAVLKGFNEDDQKKIGNILSNQATGQRPILPPNVNP